MSGKNVVSQLCPITLSTNQIAGSFAHHYLRKESMDILHSLHRDNHQEKVASETHFQLGVASFDSHLVRLQDSFIISISRNNQVISFA